MKGHLAPKTAKLHEGMIRLYLAPHLGRTDIRRISVSMVDDLWTRLMDKGLSKRTMQMAVGTLRLILAEAIARGELSANVVNHWKAVQPKGRGSSARR